MSFKCYDSKTSYYNPLSLTHIKNDFLSSACIPSFNEDTNSFIDYVKCSDNISNNKDDTNYLLIHIPFFTKDYINKYYDIKSMDNFIDWVDKNNHLSSYYISNIHDMTIKVYGNDIKQLNNKVLKYHYQYYKMLYPEKFNIKFNDFISWFPDWFVETVNTLIIKKEKTFINNINNLILKKI